VAVQSLWMRAISQASQRTSKPFDKFEVDAVQNDAEFRYQTW